MTGYPPWYTQDDINWEHRHRRGIKPNPIPFCKFRCQGCGRVTTGISGDIAFCSTCADRLSKLPYLYEAIRAEHWAGTKYRAGLHIVED